MSVLHAPRKPDVDRRLIWFPIIIVPMFFVLFLRLWYLQVVKAPELIENASQTRRVSVDKLAPRGTIRDRKGKIIAGVKPEYVVSILPSTVKSAPEVIAKVAALLDLPVEEVMARIKKGSYRNLPAPIKLNVSIEVASMIAEASDLPGVAVEEKPMRMVADPANFTHLLGYVGTPTEVEEKKLEPFDLKPAEFVGRSGLEAAYEVQLMGRAGRETIEKRGTAVLPGRELAEPGKQMFLTIDADLQAYAQAVLSRRGWKGSITVIDPSNGEILAMVSNPTFPLSLYEGGMSDADYERLNDKNQGQAALNRATSGLYAPGSTYKIITAIAAYREHKLTRNTHVFCNGYFSFGRGRPLKCMSTHGSAELMYAMSNSCNTFFCTMGTRAGEEAMLQAALDCGLGNKTEIEIPERRGTIPTKKWRDMDPVNRSWNMGQLANMSIGQGYVTTNTVQMANMMAMVANNGVRYKPHLVRAFRDSITGKDEMVAPVVANRIDLDEGFWSMLRQSLVGVIDHGTARRFASIPGLTWGGKTGSAEHGKKGANNTHAWFVGFAPADKPKLAICAMAEDAGHGGDAAAPLAAEVVAHYLMRPAAAASNRVASAAGSNPRSRG
ncbi:MAG: penicillin-binding protein 2 [Armatimonadota bacterium]